MKHLLLFLCALLGLQYSVLGQQASDGSKALFLGPSVQVYPAGIIPTINLESRRNEKVSWVYRLGANIVDRQDFSADNGGMEEEEGAGFGGSIGYRRHFEVGKGEFIGGLNLDVWNLWIDWRDGISSPNPRSGTTYTLVLQPWLEGGYFLPLGKTNSSKIGLTLGFGREINTITSGEDVAQGFIGSVSLQYYFAL